MGAAEHGMPEMTLRGQVSVGGCEEANNLGRCPAWGETIVAASTLRMDSRLWLPHGGAEMTRSSWSKS